MKKLFSLLLLLFFSLTISAQQKEGFSIEPISEAVRNRMVGKSYPEKGAKISLDDLRYLRVLHYDAEGKVKSGEIVVNKAIANDVLAIFKELYAMKYPIQRIRLIDDYNAVDENSMRDNNTSAFCYREIKGSKMLSKHARGMAIDINTLYNPCFKVDKANGKGYKPGTLQPATAEKYVNRTNTYPYTISLAVVKIFKKYGFRWGGDWASKKDYQHFER